jgi:hypothetical protein
MLQYRHRAAFSTLLQGRPFRAWACPRPQPCWTCFCRSCRTSPRGLNCWASIGVGRVQPQFHPYHRWPGFRRRNNPHRIRRSTGSLVSPRPRRSVSSADNSQRFRAATVYRCGDRRVPRVDQRISLQPEGRALVSECPNHSDWPLAPASLAICSMYRSASNFLPAAFPDM